MIGGVLRPVRGVRVSAVAGIVLIAGAGAAGWVGGHVSVPPEVAPPPSPWALPQPRPTDAEADAATLRSRRPWGGPAGFGETAGHAPAPAALAAWRFVGTITRDGRSFALIEIGPQPGGKLEYLGIGDRLPDGSVVLQIASDSMTTEGRAGLAAGPIVYRLFDKKS